MQRPCWSAAPVATDCLYKHLGYNQYTYYARRKVYVWN